MFIRDLYGDIINTDFIRAYSVDESEWEKQKQLYIVAEMDNGNMVRLFSVDVDECSVARGMFMRMLKILNSGRGPISMYQLYREVKSYSREITLGERTVNGEVVQTETTEFVSANILEAECATTGYCGGDSGHGGRTYIRLKNLGGTDIKYRINGSGTCEEELEIMLGGDTELSTIIEAFRWIADTLERQAKERSHE